MSAVQITDHADQAVARLPQRMKDMPRWRALVSALVSAVQPIEDVLWDIFAQRSVDAAVGEQLDVIGRIVGQPRGGLSDSTYRQYLRGALAVRRSRGTVEDVIRVCTQMCPDFDAIFPGDTTVTVKPYYPAAIEVHLGGLVPSDDVFLQALEDFLKRTVAAGVRVVLRVASFDGSGGMFEYGGPDGTGFGEGHYAEVFG